MKILPPVTDAWGRVIVRRHTPKPVSGKSGYQAYRPCLRWEFGFSCALCLCHEADLAPYQIEDSGLTHAEHIILKSRDSARRNAYDNLLYCCRFCNVSRGIAPHESAEGNLINPCERVWNDVFRLVDDLIKPRDESNRDAVYTVKSYKLNAPPKVRMRKLRRGTILPRLRDLEELPVIERDLLDEIETGGGKRPARMAKAVARLRRQAYMDLRKFRAIPEGRDTKCRCGSTKHHTLPGVLGVQTIDVAYPQPERRAAPRNSRAPERDEAHPD